MSWLSGASLFVSHSHFMWFSVRFFFIPTVHGVFLATLLFISQRTRQIWRSIYAGVHVKSLSFLCSFGFTARAIFFPLHHSRIQHSFERTLIRYTQLFKATALQIFFSAPLSSSSFYNYFLPADIVLTNATQKNDKLAGLFSCQRFQCRWAKEEKKKCCSDEKKHTSDYHVFNDCVSGSKLKNTLHRQKQKKKKQQKKSIYA